MSPKPVAPPVVPTGGPLVPPIPSKLRRHGRPSPGQRSIIWTGSLIIGVAVGIAAYQWIPGVDVYFDYWLALAFG